MAVQTNSDLLTNTYATSPLQNPTYTDGPWILRKIAVNATAVADGVGSQYRICQVASSDCIAGLSYVNDAIGTGSSLKLGLYETNSTVVANSVAGNAALFLATVGMVTATTALTPCRFAVLLANTAPKRVWELLGLPSDPKKNYDLCWTVLAVGTATGNIAFAYDFTR